jgi:hypothetical protein
MTREAACELIRKLDAKGGCMLVFSSPIKKLFATHTRKAGTTGALAMVVVAAISAAYATIPDSSGVIHGCYNTKYGQLRVIDPTVSNCTPTETPLEWSQTGPQGVVGPQGPPGPQGPAETTAFGGFSQVQSDGLPDDMATLGKLLLPAGKYAIFAKIKITNAEFDADLTLVVCRLIAESDVDEGNVLGEGKFVGGVISLNLLHEFAAEGFAQVACTDFGSASNADYADAVWEGLRITAITLGSFQNGPLLQ